MSNEKEPIISSSSEVEKPTDEMKSYYPRTKDRYGWYYTPAFLLFWLALFFAVVYPIFFRLPQGLTIDEEALHDGEFIAERAQRILHDFAMIGPKVTGSHANENLTKALLLDEIEKIRNVMLEDLFDIEVDVQQVSGAYIHWTMINMYQGLQNVVVKLSNKQSTSNSYLLINSHFDSKPGSPGAADDGAMVVIMLEILRVLATTRQPLEHPIVFLWNGAEENPLQASHGFITQHKWAKNCKALINLDSAGSGHKELLFQSGPNHPWLIKYYRKLVKTPYATSLAEEIFQANIIPSDTDFRIFRNFGQVPGLDLAHTLNGYVYHTKFDQYSLVPRGTLQSTGDNILALARGLANAPELRNPKLHEDGHNVFYDFLGLFVVVYTETEGKIINTVTSIIAIVLILVSFGLMGSSSYVSLARVWKMFTIIFVLHVCGFVLAFGLPLLMAVMFDSGDRSMTYFTNKWLVIGLYICPALIGLSAPTLIFLSLNRSDKLSRSFRLQMVLHAHCVVLAIICLAGTYFGIRSSYIPMMSIFFYACSLLLNLITTLHGRHYHWTPIVVISQIIPFIYFSYRFHSFLCILTPMMGRFGSATNPDLIIALLVALGTVMSMGFLIPLLNVFQRTKVMLTSLLIVTFIFSMIAVSPVGFPYRPETNVGRVNFLHVRRVFYEYDGSVSHNDSGYYFDFQDRRMHRPIESSIDVSNMVSIADDCEDYMMCGLPVFNHRWYKARKQGRWLPADEPTELPSQPTLTLLEKSVNETTKSVYFQFELSGSPHMSIFLQPLEGVAVTDWSFIKDMLQQGSPPPYHIFFTYGNDNKPLIFDFVLQKSEGILNVPLLELGIAAHYVSFEHERGNSSREFIQSFPDYIFVMEWPSSYERYIF